MNRRRPAFDPSRLDDIDDLLPPSPTSAESLPAPRPAHSVDVPVRPASEDGTARLVQGEASVDEEKADVRVPDEQAVMTGERDRSVRGQGGRPPGRGQGQRRDVDAARVQVAVRIAYTLYEQVTQRLLTGPERPSYGQLVAWTCEDHPGAVLDEVVAARARVGARQPRGRRLAVEAVQVTLRMTLTERSRLDAISERVREAYPGRVTRTEVATAALRTAIDYTSPRDTAI